jgi:tripartite-type tricarboxylate transporter receptor subunit TctC
MRRIILQKCYGHTGPDKTRYRHANDCTAQGIKLNYVPLHGDSPALTAFLGHVMVAGMNSGTFISHKS